MNFTAVSLAIMEELEIDDNIIYFLHVFRSVTFVTNPQIYIYISVNQPQEKIDRKMTTV